MTPFYALKEYQQIGRQIRMLKNSTTMKGNILPGAILTVVDYEYHRNLLLTAETDEHGALILFGWTEGNAWELC